jgi:hypothetical protein
MTDDLDAARHIFGYVTSELGYFQVIGAVLLVLTVHLSLRRWRHG